MHASKQEIESKHVAAYLVARRETNRLERRQCAIQASLFGDPLALATE
jgi:hypothetical protein